MRQRTIDFLRSGHRNMQRVLTLVRAQVNTLRGTGDLEGFMLLNNAIGYMYGYPRLAHHPAEDIIFEKLARASTVSRTVCDILQKQHREFAEQEADMLRWIREAQSGDGEAYRMLREQAAVYCVAHADHIMTEEMELFPTAGKLLGEADWYEAIQKFQGLSDAVFDGAELKRYESLYDYLMSSTRKPH